MEQLRMDMDPIENRWSLALQPLHMHMQMQIFDALRSNSSNSLMPAIAGDISSSVSHSARNSSLSSSDLETESSVSSFFPDESTTLGSLMGFHSHPSFRRSPTPPLYPRHIEEDGEEEEEDREERQEREGGSEIEGKCRFSACGKGWWSLVIRCAMVGLKDGPAIPSFLLQILHVERKPWLPSSINNNNNIHGQAATGRGSREEKVYINIMYEELEGFVPDANPLFVETLIAPTTMIVGHQHMVHDDVPLAILEGSPSGNYCKSLTKYRVCMPNCVAGLWSRRRSLIKGRRAKYKRPWPNNIVLQRSPRMRFDR